MEQVLQQADAASGAVAVEEVAAAAMMEEGKLAGKLDFCEKMSFQCGILYHSRPPRPPRRPMGRIMHLSDITVPGGCAGGSCGR